MKVSVRPLAAKQLRKTNEPMKGRIMAALSGLEQEPPEGDIKSLTGVPGLYRLRVGGYRVLFIIAEEGIIITGIEPRGGAYKKGSKST